MFIPVLKVQWKWHQASSCFRVSHTYREGNQLADHLAARALQEGDYLYSDLSTFGTEVTSTTSSRMALALGDLLALLYSYSPLTKEKGECRRGSSGMRT